MADAADIAHLLRRTEFVARPARVAELSALSIDDAVTSVMDFAPNGNPTVPPSLAVHNSADSYTQRVTAFHWWLDQMATRPRPFQEKMTLFWHGHFTTEWDVVGRSDHMMRQNQLYRSQGLSNFLSLTQAMSIEPAMLIYLSNATNVKGTPNQNFARELMELFTLGVGNYSEDDVAAAARAWTGHNYNGTTALYEFRPTRHDIGNKTFFGTSKNWDGPDIVNEILRDNLPKQADRGAADRQEDLGVPGLSRSRRHDRRRAGRGVRGEQPRDRSTGASHLVASRVLLGRGQAGTGAHPDRVGRVDDGADRPERHRDQRVRVRRPHGSDDLRPAQRVGLEEQQRTG